MTEYERALELSRNAEGVFNARVLYAAGIRRGRREERARNVKAIEALPADCRCGNLKPQDVLAAIGIDDGLGDCTIRLCCFFCGKSVSSPAPDDLVVRAVLVCPECIESGQVRVEGKGILLDLLRVAVDRVEGEGGQNR